MFKFIAVAYLLCAGHALLSQSANPLIGSRSQALGYTSACIADAWSLFNNVAGLANVKRSNAGFTYEAYPHFKYFNRTALTASLPVKFGVAGFGLLRYGDALYNEQVAALGFANTFGMASLGVKVNYIQYHAEGFGNKGLLSLSFGGIARFTERLAVGAHIVHINQGKITDEGNERLPTIIQVGLSFTPSEKLTVATEVQKDLDYDPLWKGGIEYQPIKKFAARTGFNMNPDAAFAGFGIHLRKMHFDYAAQFFCLMGSVHQATITYYFKPDLR